MQSTYDSEGHHASTPISALLMRNYTAEKFQTYWSSEVLIATAFKKGELDERTENSKFCSLHQKDPFAEKR